MAGSVTFSEDRSSNRGLQTITAAWTSDASGDVSGTSTRTVSGRLARVVTNPDDSAAPTDNYDVTLLDADGVDVLAGAAADRDTANSEQILLDPPVAVHGPLQPVVANAGNAKAGAIVLYFA